MGLLLPASAAQEGIPIRVTRPDARIGSFEVWAEECDEGGNPTGGARYESSSTPAPGGTMDYYIPVPFPTHRQDYLVHVKSVPDERCSSLRGPAPLSSGAAATRRWPRWTKAGR